MSKQNGQREKESDANQKVLDEEGDVDSKVKDLILQARQRVADTKYAVDVKEPLNADVEIRRPRKIQIFAKTVKQFLIRIEPLLRADRIVGNEYYYEDMDEPIGTVELVPPDTDGYQFSLVARRGLDERELRTMIGLPLGAEIPEPEVVAFTGLKEIIERPPVLSYQWSVCVSKQGARPNWDFAYPEVQRQVPEQIYIDAIREADSFLHDIGIGVDTGLPNTDEESQVF